ncbi:MAG: ABC transporter ATP-binding protein [Spirochaetia bacterium]|jgi:branched-chain amino acid transport system ATP-binding protein
MSDSNATGAILEIGEITKYFGGLCAVKNFSLSLPRGALWGLIGPNGAGKTTVFNLITGLLPLTSGSINLDGERIDGLEAFEITRLGTARTFQNIRLFSSLSVLDNVRVAYHAHVEYGLTDSFLRTRKFLDKEKELSDQALDFLSIFKLDGIAEEIARNLPYGEQRRVEIARALACKPKVLLLDEPAAGMNPREIGQLMELIHFIRDRFKLTILLIEHQMRVVMGICERITVMDFGEVIARGTPKEIAGDQMVIEAYLGKGAATSAAG